MILKEITEESFRLLEECREDKVTLFVSGGGGKVSILQQMLYIINSNPDRFTIVTADYNGSCNFFLLLFAKCKVVILDEAVGGYHHAFQQREINSLGKPRDFYENFMLSELNRFRQKELRMIKELELSPEETERVERGAFVYFHADRMIELIKKDWSWFFGDSLEEYICVNDDCTKANGGLRYHFSSKPTEYCPKCLHNSVTTVNKFQELKNPYKLGDLVTTKVNQSDTSGNKSFVFGRIVTFDEKRRPGLKVNCSDQIFYTDLSNITGYYTSVSNTDGANTTTTYKGGDNITNTQDV